MYPSKPVFVLAFICLALATESTFAVTTRACSIVFKCDMVENVVWASDGSRCFSLRNECHLNKENCQRLNNHEKSLQKIDRSECQQLCLPPCPPVWQPVCAEYNGVERTFGSDCELTNHICRTAETYNLVHDGECDN